MQPGDLVRVRNHTTSYAVHHGKIGVIVDVRRIANVQARRAVAEVLVDGNIHHFYLNYLEPVDATR